MNEPLVTVILPCYNCENFIADALDSIVNQSYPNLELIIIDDGSTDKSIEVITEQINSDQRAKILKNEKNLGLIQTLNRGIALANGQYIARMDADDISHPDRIKYQVDYLTKHPEIDILGTEAIPMSLDGTILTRNSVTYTSKLTLKFSVLFSQPFFHGSILAKTKVLKEHPYSEDFKHSEDFELWNRLSYYNYKLCNLPLALYFYRINPQGVSTQFESIQIDSHNLASKKYIDIILGKAIDLSIISILNNRPDSALTINHIVKASKVFDELDKKINIAEKEVELQRYIVLQKVDILIQCAKKSNSLTVIAFCGSMLTFSLIKKEAFSYLIKKFLNK